MQYLLLLLFFASPFLLPAQNSTTEQMMEKLGYQKVDLDALKKQQSASKKSCSSCPLVAKKVPSSFNVQHEIQKLKNQLPRLEQVAANAQKDPNIDPSMKQKYQADVNNTKQRIHNLEQQVGSK